MLTEKQFNNNLLLCIKELIKFVDVSTSPSLQEDIEIISKCATYEDFVWKWEEESMRILPIDKGDYNAVVLKYKPHSLSYHQKQAIDILLDSYFSK